MENFKWNDKLKVGENGIDSQHKEIIEHFNIINEMFENKIDTETIKVSITNLLKKLCDHIRYEEAILEKCHYFDIENHIKEHEKHKEIVEVNTMKLFTGNIFVIKEFFEWFREVLTQF